MNETKKLQLETNSNLKNIYDKFVNIDNLLSQNKDVTVDQYDELYQSFNDLKNIENSGVNLSLKEKVLEDNLYIYFYVSRLIDKVYDSCKISSYTSSYILSPEDQKKCLNATRDLIHNHTQLQKNAVNSMILNFLSDDKEKEMHYYRLETAINALKSKSIDCTALEEYMAGCKQRSEYMLVASGVDAMKVYVDYFNKQSADTLLPLIYGNDAVNDKNYIPIFVQTVKYAKMIKNICKDFYTKDTSFNQCVESFMRIDSKQATPLNIMMAGTFDYDIVRNIIQSIKDKMAIVNTDKIANTHIIFISHTGFNDKDRDVLNRAFYDKGVKIMCPEKQCSLTKTETNNMVAEHGELIVYFRKINGEWFDNTGKKISEEMLGMYQEKYFIEGFDSVKDLVDSSHISDL